MRKVKYIINDLEYLKRVYDLNDTDDILKDIQPFKAIYTLIDEGNGNYYDRYELTDFEGNKININSLNGYQRGVVLYDCVRHFTGQKPQYGGIYMFEKMEEVKGNKGI